MTNGWPAPASQELGANWVGVTARERVEGQFNQELKRLKTWPATARRFRSGTVDEHARVSRSALLSRIEGGQPGSASHSLKDFRFSIADCQLIASIAVGWSKSRNWKSAIGNWP